MTRPERLGATACLAALALLLSGCPLRPTRPPVEPPVHREPQVAGVTHVVKPGETLWRIARAYGVAPDELVRANGLSDPSRLEPGQKIFVPGARKLVAVPAAEDDPPARREPAPARAEPPPRKDSKLGWPLLGVIYAKFGPRGESRHDGLDLAAPLSTPIHAAGAGVVLFSGEQPGYGFVVILDHGGGLLTVYAHNLDNLVKEGEQVQAGQPIARVGEASRTSGPHLHFEVREGTEPRDPLKYLPPPR